MRTSRVEKIVSGPRCGGTAGWKVVAGMLGLIFVALAIVFVAKDRFVITRDGAYFLAKISASQDAMWGAGRGGTEGLKDGDWLQESTVVLKSGAAELEFDSGAIVSLRGPAEFEISSAHRATLVYGVARVEVPSLSAAFTVETPWTEAGASDAVFGLKVSPGDQTDLYVIEGMVEFARLEGLLASQSGMIPGGQAVSVVSSNAPTLLDFTPGVVDFTWPTPVASDGGMSRWIFEEREGLAWPDVGQGWEGSPLKAVKLGHPVALGDGRIRFGEPSSLQATSPLTAPKGPVTVAATVRVSEGALWIRYWSDKRYSRHWGLGVEARADGGRVRLETGRKQYRGFKNLADGEWHRVVAVLIPSADFRGSADVRVYVDGQLEGLSLSGEDLVTSDDVEDVARIEISGSGASELGEVSLYGYARRPRDIRKD